MENQAHRPTQLPNPSDQAHIRLGRSQNRLSVAQSRVTGILHLRCQPAIRFKTSQRVAKVLLRGLKAYKTKISVHFNGLELLARSFEDTVGELMEGVNPRG